MEILMIVALLLLLGLWAWHERRNTVVWQGIDWGLGQDKTGIVGVLSHNLLQEIAKESGLSFEQLYSIPPVVEWLEENFPVGEPIPENPFVKKEWWDATVDPSLKIDEIKLR